MKPLVVCSLFDGMSCGQIAFERVGMPITTYYASEIDKYAQIVRQANYPNSIPIGDVRNVKIKGTCSKDDQAALEAAGYKFIEVPDILIGGSPCQSFSFAGKRKGMSTKDEIEILTLDHYLTLKSQNFEFEGQSYLFWEYMRILTEIRQFNPNVLFLLENVLMGAKWQKVLTQAIGINPIEINSALVSAQNRQRLYWTNIAAKPDGFFGDLKCAIPQPKDKGILLRDILEHNVDKKYYMSDKMMEYFNNRAANFNNGKINVRDEEGKASTITASCKSVDISDNFVEIITDAEKNLEIDTVVNDNGKLRHTDKGMCLDANYYKGMDNHAPLSMVIHNFFAAKKTDMLRLTKQGDFPENQSKAGCLTAGGHSGGNHSDMDLIVCLTEVRTDEAKKIRRETGTNPKRAKYLAERTDGKTGAILTGLTNDNLILTKNYLQYDLNGKGYGSQDQRAYYAHGKSGTLNTKQSGAQKNLLSTGEAEKNLENMGAENTVTNINTKDSILGSRIRRLTPTECERLQTVPDNYTAHVSDTQRYKMLGNGWTIDVIAHIFSFIK